MLRAFDWLAIREPDAATTPCSSSIPEPFRGRSLAVSALNRAPILRGCFSSVLDLAIARNIRLGGSRNIQFRVDMFNLPNSAIITGRNTTMNLSSPSDPVTATNLP